MDAHVHFILTQCAQRMYVLKLLNRQGLPCSPLTVSAYSAIISRILYSLPVFGKFLSSELVAKIDAFLKRLKHFGYMTRIITTAELMYDADHMLFIQVCLHSHCLHIISLFLFTLMLTYDRGHIYQLPTCYSLLHKESFLTPTLYDFV